MSQPYIDPRRVHPQALTLSGDRVVRRIGDPGGTFHISFDGRHSFHTERLTPEDVLRLRDFLDGMLRDATAPEG